LPRSAILIDIGGESGSGEFSESLMGIGAVRMGSNPGRNEDIDGDVTGVEGGAGGVDIVGAGVRGLDDDAILVLGGFHMLEGEL
jgi:hypothetical protein